MARWAFVLAETDGAELGELTTASARKITPRLDGAMTAGATISGRDFRTADFEELSRDLIVYRDGVNLFRGRCSVSSDTIDASAHSLALSAIDYRGMLDTRYLHATDTLTWAGVDQAEIAWESIEDSEARAGSFGLSQGSGSPTGVLRTRTLEVGKGIGEALRQLGNVDNGFEWEVDPELAFNVFYPQRGSDQGFIADYRGTVETVGRDFDPASFATAVIVTGGTGTTPEERAIATIATAPEGRIERVFSYPDVIEQATLAAKAGMLIADLSVKRAAWKVRLGPNRWPGKAGLWVGDTVTNVVRSGRLNVVEAMRVVEMDISVTPENTEVVDLTLGRATLQAKARARPSDVEKRLAELERRTG